MNKRAETRLTAEELERLRALTASDMPREDLRKALGNIDVQTIRKAAAGEPVSRLTAEVIRIRLVSMDRI